jgi:uncharacterized membrane protein
MRVSTIFTVGLLLLGCSAFGHGNGDDWHMGGRPTMGGGMWCLVVWIVVAIAVVVLIIFLVRYLTARGSAGKAEKRSLGILKERYAKGERLRGVGQDIPAD